MFAHANNEWRARTAHVLGASLFLIQAGWAVVLLVLIVLKVIENGALSYVRYFTNWVLAFQALFYLATLPVPLAQHGIIDRRTSSAAHFAHSIVALCFFPLNGILFTVQLVVTVLLGTNSPFLADFIDDLPLPIILIGNDLFHLWPIVIHLIFAIAYQPTIYKALAAWVPSRRGDRFGFVATQAYFGPVIPLTIYASIFDPREVYETTISFAAGAGVVFWALTTFNLVPVILTIVFGVAPRQSADASASHPKR